MKGNQTVALPVGSLSSELLYEYLVPTFNAFVLSTRSGNVAMCS